MRISAKYSGFETLLRRVLVGGDPLNKGHFGGEQKCIPINGSIARGIDFPFSHLGAIPCLDPS
jgi:hypothetical protein